MSKSDLVFVNGPPFSKIEERQQEGAITCTAGEEIQTLESLIKAIGSVVKGMGFEE
jgi:tRNA1(Val) A37 N6-methylase TrmN6